jgi:hypothetical protein
MEKEREAMVVGLPTVEVWGTRVVVGFMPARTRRRRWTSAHQRWAVGGRWWRCESARLRLYFQRLRGGGSALGIAEEEDGLGTAAVAEDAGVEEAKGAEKPT